MKKLITKATVFMFAVAALGTMSLSPSTSYGLSTGDHSGGQGDGNTLNEMRNNAEYERAYTEAFERAEIERASQLLADEGGEDDSSSCG